MTLRPTDALLVIDMQIDFLPGGSLAVRGGEAILPGINALGARFEHVVATQDWHPAGHISFASAHPGKQPFVDTIQVPYGVQTLWPDHCVQNTPGSRLAPALDIPHVEMLLRKGFRKDIDSYSAFCENDKHTRTGLTGFLREREFKRVFLCGLAFDFCVAFSALDAQRLGFEAIVLEDLTGAANLPGSVEATRGRFAEHNVRTCASSTLTDRAGR